MPQLLLLAAVIIWGTTFVATKICLEYLGPLQLVASRFLLAFPLLYLLARVKKLPPVNKRHLPRLGIAAAVFTGHFLWQAVALQFTTATNAGWIIAVAPLAILLLAAAILKEPIYRATWMGITIATVGVVLLVSGGDRANLTWLYSVGDWMMLASTLSWAIFTIVSRDVARQTHPLAVTMIVTLPLAVVGLIQMFLDPTWVPLSQMPGKATVALVFLALAGLALAQWFWQEGVARLGAAKAGLFLYLEPIATTALAVPYLGEPFGWAVAVGGALVLLGVFVAEKN